MKNVNLTVTMQKPSGETFPQMIMIDAETRLVDLEQTVREAIPVQTHIAAEDHVSVVSIKYDVKGN